MQLAQRLRDVFSLDPSAWAIEFEGASYSWGALNGLAGAVGDAVKTTGAEARDVVGWAAQNSPAGVAAMVGLIMAEHCAAILNPHMAPKSLCDEIVRQRFPVIIGDPKFWALAGVAEAVKQAGSAGLVMSWTSKEAAVSSYPGLEQKGAGPHRAPMPDVVIERLSSGTTGPPKRSPQTLESMMNALILGERKEAGGDEVLRLKRSPSIVYRALAHAGSFAVLLAFYSARPISLHEKFTAESAIDAIRRHRPKVASFVPTMIKMIFDAQPGPEDLSSLIAIRTGTAPLDPVLQERFEEKYGVPILVDYGATEFGGAAAWTLADHKKYAKQKRGSVGRAVAGAQLRIVDAETGEPITDGGIGILEVKVEHKTLDWISTTDLASLDEDGFLYIRGRADDAILRGGFKVLPEEVNKVLRQHPAVLDVAVIGVPDERLGQVPVAVVETRPGFAMPTEAEMKSFARERLTPYQAPAAFKFVEKLPRSVSMKVIRPELLKLAQQ
jgi:long-chain acyl-CoA synthetase